MSDAEPSVPRSPGLAWWLRLPISVWIVFHLAAVFAAPASLTPSSPLQRSAMSVFRHYLQPLYLNNGYHYFAPEPALASSLLGYSLEFEDGSIEYGRTPLRSISPRLMYHRHLMLTEFLAFPRSPEHQELWYRSYARHLCRRHGAVRVSLARISHFVPTMEAAREEGAVLTDPDSYLEQPVGTWQCDEL